MSQPDPAGPQETDRYEEALARRTARLARYLKIRALIGLLLIAPCLCGVALALAFALSAFGVLDTPALGRWTQGFDAVLAVFMPSAFAWLTGRTGFMWWRHRHLDDPEHGCSVC